MNRLAAGDPYTLHTLANGLRVVIEVMPDVRSVAAGFLVRSGARDEMPELAGVSHFLEHMMFKGTAKRTWREITIDFDRMGSTYNAFTSEDRTFYYGWVPTTALEKQIELLADMMQAALPADEFATEKNVILEEIAMSKDHLEHVMFDFLQEKVFAGHELAWPILGYDSTVSRLTRDQMWEYFQRRYAPDNMVLIVAGKVEPQQVIDYAETRCGSWKASGTRHTRRPPKIHGGVDVLKLDRFKQQVLALTFPSIAATDSRIETAAAAASILGGENSRFFWNIVQKGIAPRAGAHHLDYADCGAMILFAACQPERAEDALAAIRSEAKAFCENGVRESEVDRVKNKRRTSLAIEAEAPYYRLTQLIDDMEYHGRPRTVDEMLGEVDAVSVTSIRNYVRDFPLTIDGHLTSVGPRAFPTS
jgi:predicted Zn-dependent peptidase